MIQSVQATRNAPYSPATKPTMYFIGVTTGKSSIMKVFPRWAENLRLGDVEIKGIDCKWHDDPEVYRAVVQFIKEDKYSLGALVTTHKLDLLKACRDMFDELDPFAKLMGEVSSISKREGRLIGHAKDLITSGLAHDAFMPKRHWEKNNKAEILLLGAGGSSIALSCYLIDPNRGADRPARIVVSNRSPGRLEEMHHIHEKLNCRIPIEYHHTPQPEDNDVLTASLAPHSLVINATGLGKDAPGSPITNRAGFPERGFAWDFNYRGELIFLDQARAQQQKRHLHVEDGWIYFLHGWTRVIAEVFNVEIPTSGPKFDELSEIARQAR